VPTLRGSDWSENFADDTVGDVTTDWEFSRRFNIASSLTEAKINSKHTIIVQLNGIVKIPAAKSLTVLRTSRHHCVASDLLAQIAFANFFKLSITV